MERSRSLWVRPSGVGSRSGRLVEYLSASVLFVARCGWVEFKYRGFRVPRVPPSSPPFFLSFAGRLALFIGAACVPSLVARPPIKEKSRKHHGRITGRARGTAMFRKSPRGKRFSRSARCIRDVYTCICPSTMTHCHRGRKRFVSPGVICIFIS